MPYKANLCYMEELIINCKVNGQTVQKKDKIVKFCSKTCLKCKQSSQKGIRFVSATLGQSVVLVVFMKMSGIILSFASF